MKNVKRLLTLALIFAFSLTIISTPVLAVNTSPTVSDMEKELSLTMPDTTEDPNYPITFIDPSKQGVDVTVDTKTTTKAPSPFLLPGLSIGSHTLVFKFKTKDNLLRILTEKILIVPKAPTFDQTLKTVVVRPNQADLKGTALPQSTILVIVNSEKTYQVTASTTGVWELLVPDQHQGANSVMAFAVKDGIVSQPSKVFSYQYKLQDDAVTPTQAAPSVSSSSITVALQDLLANINKNRIDDPGMFYGIISLALLLIFVVLGMSLRKQAAKKRDEKTIAALFGTLQKDGGTIVDVIQSSKKQNGKEPVVEHEVVSIKKKKGKKSRVVRVVPTTPEPEAPTTEKKGFNIFGLLKPKTEETKTQEQPAPSEVKKKDEPKVTKPEKETIEEPVIDIETEEPEKKVLTKEEFLKQFQKSSGQDE